jgi:hypothetical protein
MLSQDLGGLRPAAQVLRARLVSETAEIDTRSTPAIISAKLRA